MILRFQVDLKNVANTAAIRQSLDKQNVPQARFKLTRKMCQRLTRVTAAIRQSLLAKCAADKFQVDLKNAPTSTANTTAIWENGLDDFRSWSKGTERRLPMKTQRFRNGTS